MNRRYIELYSANRNRQQYPQAASFTVPFGAPQPTAPYLKDPVNQIWANPSVDPVTSGVVSMNWQGGIGIVLPAQFLKAGTTDSTPLLVPPVAGLSNIYNYYLGYYLSDITISQTRTITNYTPSAASVNLEQAFSGAAAGNNYAMFDPSNGTAVAIPPVGNIYTTTPAQQIHIPAVDSSGNAILTYAQAYNGYYIIDETMTLANGGTPVYAQITSFDNATNIATIDRAFSPGVWNVNDVYTLRKTLPSTQTAIAAPGATSTTIALNVPATPYIGQFIYITNISSVAGGTFTPNTTTYANQAYFVVSAVGNVATVNNITGVSPAPVAVGQMVNIVAFTRDNYIPLLYSGGLVSQSEASCYEVSIIDLSLPNVVLTTGSRVAFYPYVYVQLTNVSSSTSASNNIIYSNNPNSTNALFICTVTDISQPVNSSFVKIDSGTQTQTIKFKPTDSLKFSVFLPDGTLFQTFTPDNYSPYPPNFTLQIDAVFSIKKLT